jgi:uncharacterized protein (TIGR00251 family)
MRGARCDGADLVIDVRVQPRAARTEFAGALGERFKVRLKAPPVDGRANAALVEFLAEKLGVPRACVVIVQGHTGRDKRVRIHGAGHLAAQMEVIAGLD